MSLVYIPSSYWKCSDHCEEKALIAKMTNLHMTQCFGVFVCMDKCNFGSGHLERDGRW
jgi:hypothetical protein